MQYFQKLIQKDHGFTHNLLEPLSSSDRAEIWSLHRGTAKEGGDASLVFHFDPNRAASNLTQKQSLAKTAHTRLKTLRHPDILKYLTSVEGSDGTVYIATEPAVPLSNIMSESPSKLDRETIQWGLYTIARALGFMHQSGLIHGRLNTSTVFVTPTGDWKLAGLECVTPHSAAASLAQHATSLQLPPYQSPEFSNSNWASVASAAPSAVDSWALGCLMFETHAGSLTSAENLKNISSLPKPLHSAYQKLLASNPSMRAPAGQLPNHPYFQNSKFVELNLFVENLALKGQLEQEAFLSKLPSTMDRLPDGFCTFKVLPMLSQNIASGNGGAAAFACVVKMKDRLSPSDFSTHVVNKYALTWFSNQNMDRNLKAELLSKLDLFATHLNDTVINSTVFPAICNAFQEAQSPALRDSAVKSVLLIVDRLSDKNLNNVLMSHFARLQVDPEPAIRTNTTVCLGKIAGKLSQTARVKVLAAAFVRALKDPFPPARAAGVNAILVTAETYSVKEMATRLLPAVSPLLVDGSAEVRTLAFRVLDNFKAKLAESHERQQQYESETAASQVNGSQSGTVPSSTSGGTSSGWGLSSFTSMTAALLNKSESAPGSHTNPSGTAVGISSEDFRNVGDHNVGNALGKNIDQRRSKASTFTGGVEESSSVGEYWGASNGQLGSLTNTNNLKGGAPSLNVKSSAPVNEPIPFDADLTGIDDDMDGWGDMDVKAENGPNEDEALSAILGKPPSSDAFTKASAGPPPTGPARQAREVGDHNAGLWDLGPSQISRPKPRVVGPSSRGGGSRVGSGRKAKSGGDDWEALLGGSSSNTRRKVVGRKP